MNLKRKAKKVFSLDRHFHCTEITSGNRGFVVGIVESSFLPGNVRMGGGRGGMEYGGGRKAEM